MTQINVRVQIDFSVRFHFQGRAPKGISLLGPGAFTAKAKINTSASVAANQDALDAQAPRVNWLSLPSAARA
jgi:hypothetical protein